MRIRKILDTPSLSSEVIAGSDKIGMVKWYAGNTAPEGYLFCDGSAISRVLYKSLFDVIGTTYGSGDGETTFNLPNLKSRTIIGYEGGMSGVDLGVTGGIWWQTLTQGQVPHFEGTFPHTAGDETLVSGIVSHVNSSSKVHEGSDNGQVADKFHKISFGNGEPFENMPPYIVLHAVIKAYGETPITSSVLDILGSTSITDALSANQGTIIYQELGQLEYQVTDIDDRVGGLSTTVSGLSTSLGQTNTTVGNLSTTVSGLNTKVNALPKYEYGRLFPYQFTYNSSSSNSAYTYTFKNTYSSVPQIFLCPSDTQSQTYYGITNAKCSKTTKTSSLFTWGLKSNDWSSSARDIWLDYLIIGT